MLNHYINRMSASLAAAKKRRAPAQPTPPTPSYGAPQTTSPSLNSNAPVGLTLPQVIQVVDHRLLALETNMKNLSGASVPSNVAEVLDTFTDRFNQLAEEVENLKNIVLSLQSYTMDVNKMLLEERVQLLGGDSHNKTALERAIELEQNI